VNNNFEARKQFEGKNNFRANHFQAKIFQDKDNFKTKTISRQKTFSRHKHLKTISRQLEKPIYFK